MPVKTPAVTAIVFFLLVLSYAVYRDIRLDKQYPDDLRNRVVGARIISDGYSPYFYKWKKKDGTRYYDPKSFDTLKVSNITSSPFFHHLIAPLAQLPERQISKCWLLIEYGMFITMIVIAFLFAATDLQRMLVFVAAALLLLTAGWKVHILAGQNYLCIPFFAMLFYYSVQRKSIASFVLAGLFASVLVMIRLNTILFFIPFLLLYKNYRVKYIAAFLLPVVIFGAFIFFNKQEFSLWKDYRAHIEEQVKFHQHLGAAVQVNETDPGFLSWEGIKKNEIDQERKQNPVHFISENGNVFVFIQLFFHKKLSLHLAALLLALSVISVTIFFTWHNGRSNTYSLLDLALLGFCLYMITDLFSPIYRWQYYTVQWFFPLLIASACYKPFQKWIFVFLGAALLLNIEDAGLITMGHSIGEYCMLAAFIWLSAHGNFSKKYSAHSKLVTARK